MIGGQLGHYRILDRLGAGGMGEVWLAEDLDLGRKVALKTLRSDVAATPAQRARLEREARSVAALNHPNIVTLFSVEEDGGTRFLVMEYVEGERLSERIPGGGLPPREALRIGAAVADALATAHAQGIVHRDLKPGNVLLTPDGRVKVVDFGLARAFAGETAPFRGPGRDTSLTQEGLAVGTLHYMSPEQLEGATLDHRSDLYSLGVLLHEMVTGELPFAGESAVRVISAILRDRPERVDVSSRHLPPAVGDLIERLLAKDPDDRPDSAAEVRDLLIDTQRRIGSATTAVDAPVRLTRSGSSRRRRAWKRGLFLAAAVVLALAGLALALAHWKSAAETHPPGGAAAPPAIAVLPLANYSDDPDYFVDGMTDGLIGALARINGLRVISRQSVMHYKGSAKRLPEIAQELGVDYVVEASLRREAGRLRLQVKLFSPDPEEQVWSDAFDRPDPEVLALHADVARSIAAAVHVAIPAAFSATRSVDPAVYEAYLRGKHLVEQARPESLRRAKTYFEEALSRDPQFAPAHAGLATVYGLLAYLYEEPAANAARQEAEARRAIEVQPDLAEAYVVLGDHLRYFRWNWAASEESYRRAVAIDPNSAAAGRALWGLLASLGRLPEARSEIERALGLDPLSAAIENDLGYQAIFEKKLAPAKLAFVRALELDPEFPPAHGGLWLVADIEQDDSTRLREMVLWLDGMSYGWASAGLRRDPGSWTYLRAAREVGHALAAPSSGQRVSLGVGGALLASAGELDRASEWIRKAYDERDPELVWLAMDPSWRALRSNANFQAIVTAMKLPADHN
jgi:serine/threonine-protein kinase